ncbi:MAG: S16 family serine protease [Candidatus Izemoplasmatales bacterium]
MNELTKKYWPFVKVLIIPYLFFMFILFYPIPYYLDTPGGITEVDSLISVDYNQDKEVTGSISSTYIVSINRPTFFQFLIGSFSDYNYANVLTGSYASYSNQEISKISYLDKETSVNAAIIVAYQKAQIGNSEINIDYDEKVMVFGKATYLSHYDEIDFGDEFLYMIGDNDFEVTDYKAISAHTVLDSSYQFFFKNSEGETYSKILVKDPETSTFGITLKYYYLVDKENTYPRYTEKESNIGGPSGGLLQTLAIYNMLIEDDITEGKKIAGTGTINYDGTVGYIGGTEQKILTAYLNKVDVFFIPYRDRNYYYDNYVEALRACEKHGIDPSGWLVPVSSFDDVLDYFENPEAYLEGVVLS